MDTTTQERTMRGFEPSMLASDAAIGATQRVIGDLTELSIGAAKENARLAVELQIAAIEALQDSHAAAQRWHSSTVESRRRM